MQIVGLTGGIGSGKSAASECFAALGVPVVDTDAISHQITAKGMPLLANIHAAFGSDCFNADGSLNRTILRQIVFTDAAARARLEAILHPAIFTEVQSQLGLHADALYQVLVVPLLFEKQNYLELTTHTLLIDCDEELQIARVMARSSMNAAEVRAILNAQMPRAEKRKLADSIIENNGNLAQLAKKIGDFHKKMLADLHS